MHKYRAYSIIRSHNRRSRTVNCDVDLNYLRSHTTPQNADLNHLRSHGAPQNADLNTARKKHGSLQCLPPRRMELANFRIEKNVNISPGMEFPSGATSKKSCTQCTCTCITPNEKIKNHPESPYKLSRTHRFFALLAEIKVYLQGPTPHRTLRTLII